MGFDMQSIQALKKQLVSSPVLSDILSSFMDIMEEPDNMPFQKTVDFETIKQDHELVQVINIVAAMASRFLEKPVEINQPVLCQIVAESFYHRFCISRDLPMPLTLLYFSDIQTGLFALSGLTAATEIFRFSLAKSENVHAAH
jgi:hypothetical protein